MLCRLMVRTFAPATSSCLHRSNREMDQPTGKLSRLPLRPACANADCDALTNCNAGSCQRERGTKCPRRRFSAMSTLRTASSILGRTKEACPRGCDSIKCSRSPSTLYPGLPCHANPRQAPHTNAAFDLLQSPDLPKALCGRHLCHSHHLVVSARCTRAIISRRC